jgi:hypothetical protein
MARGKTTALTEEAVVKKYPEIYNALIPLLRTKPDALNAYIEEVQCKVALSGTKTQAHCYFIALDGNKRPRVSDFARFIGARITNFAIPRPEIVKALNLGVQIGSTAPVDVLNMKARRLFTKLPKSGEGGEVLLSILAETFLQLPQLFTKMVLKTSTEMHVHGSDGIHVGVGQQNGNLAIYWGESKLIENPSSAIRECFSSLAPFLLDAGGGDATQERDLQLMRDGISLDDDELVAALKRYLNPDDPLFRNLEFRGLCLVGFDSASYPTEPNSKEAQQIRNEVEVAFNGNKKQIIKRVGAEKIKSFVIEIFCLPFPSVEGFRQAFRTELGLT